MKKIRVSTLLDAETLSEIQKEADEKSISVSAVIRQRTTLFSSINAELTISKRLLDVARETGVVANRMESGFTNDDFVKKRYTTNFYLDEKLIKSKKFED